MPPKRRPIPTSEQSLVCLIQSLEGTKLVVELRNDVIVRGMLDSADDYMNMVLSDATVQTLEGLKVSHEFMYLKGRCVRFVHLPRKLSPAQAIETRRQKILEARMEQLRERLRNPLGRLAKGVGPGDQSLGPADHVTQGPCSSGHASVSETTNLAGPGNDWQSHQGRAGSMPDEAVAGSWGRQASGGGDTAGSWEDGGSTGAGKGQQGGSHHAPHHAPRAWAAQAGMAGERPGGHGQGGGWQQGRSQKLNDPQQGQGAQPQGGGRGGEQRGDGGGGGDAGRHASGAPLRPGAPVAAVSAGLELEEESAEDVLLELERSWGGGMGGVQAPSDDEEWDFE